eukprot:Nitzschia sp. Nitz4//scaffold69_size99277//96853//98628//NITZ4_004653-RA/size99277-processed-gene-0.46-mRNA-1//-1//CDS//3329556775//6357//frame0
MRFFGRNSNNQYPDAKRDDSTAEDEFIECSVEVNDSLFRDEDVSPGLLERSFYYVKNNRSGSLVWVVGAVCICGLLVASPVVYKTWGAEAPVSTPISSPSATFNLDPSLEPPLVETPSPSDTPLVWVDAPAAPDPSPKPSPNPTVHYNFPTASPTTPTASPTSSPTSPPTGSPTTTPTSEPTGEPTTFPTTSPSSSPTPNPTAQPTTSPTDAVLSTVTYQPGNLTTLTEGLLLSEGLDARLIAITDQYVPYDFGGWSNQLFHGQPDAGATFEDTRDGNPGGWIYVSNAEVEDGMGGVGAITFDKDGNVLEYQWLLNGTSENCGGGRTPWGTWASCEELEFDGLIYQVDPTGEREPEVMTMGSEGGRWESFAYDIRDLTTPRFFVTEDHKKGALRRYTPENPDWEDPWSMLHGDGVTQYLVLSPNATENGGTYEWSDHLDVAKGNARRYYPESEGIDVYKNELYFVCKKIKRMFVLNLDSNTYHSQSTVSGLFDGQPDQLQRVLGDSTDLLYFTEEGGVDAGIHARDANGQFYSILESPVYVDETTGLSFSPDGKFMYTAYQDNGLLFAIWRKDGLPFNEAHLDVKIHYESS